MRKQYEPAAGAVTATSQVVRKALSPLYSFKCTKCIQYKNILQAKSLFRFFELSYPRGDHAVKSPVFQLIKNSLQFDMIDRIGFVQFDNISGFCNPGKSSVVY
jgi:hypothetical protein